MPQHDRYNEVVGEVLFETRGQLGLTQAEVSEATGISGPGLSYMERNGSIKVADLMRLALLAYGQHPSDLMRVIERKLLEGADTSTYY